MKIKLFLIVALLIFISTPAFSQQNYFGKIKVELHNGYYFLIPDSYIPATDTFLGLKNGIVKTYQNYNTATIMFQSKPIEESDETLKELGLEEVTRKALEPKMNIQLIRAIEMNGRDTLLIRGQLKKQIEIQTFQIFGKGNVSTRKATADVVAYVIKEGNYLYMSYYSSTSERFAQNYRDFMEIQNSFSNEEL